MNTKVAISVAALFCVGAVATALFVGRTDKVMLAIEPSAAVEDLVAVASPSVGQQDSPPAEMVDLIAHSPIEQEGAKHDIKTSALTEGKANMQKQLTMFGMKFNGEISALTPAELESDIAQIEKYIENNDVITRLNEEKVAKEDIPKYAQLFDHLTHLQTKGLERAIEKYGEEVEDAVKDHAAKLELYKQGALHDRKKFGSAAVAKENSKLTVELNSILEKQELSDRALLSTYLDKRS